MASLQLQGGPPVSTIPFPSPRRFLAVNTSAPPKAMAAGYSLLHLENSLPLPIIHCSATLAARSGFPFTPTPSITMNDFHTFYKGHPKPQLLTFLFSSLLEALFLFIPLHILKIGFQTSTMPANGCDLPTVLTFTQSVWPLS